MFKIVLAYLRGYETPFDDVSIAEELTHEAEYYGLTDMVHYIEADRKNAAKKRKHFQFLDLDELDKLSCLSAEKSSNVERLKETLSQEYEFITVIKVKGLEWIRKEHMRQSSTCLKANNTFTISASSRISSKIIQEINIADMFQSQNRRK